MNYSPPPLFKQGASARAKALFFTIFAICLLVIDSRLQSLSLLRQIIGTVLYPVQMVASVPAQAARDISVYFSGITELQAENNRLRQQRTRHADLLQQGGQLQSENAHLRKLLDARERMPAKSVMAEIIYDARDPSTRKLVVDRGLKDGVEQGQPVIDDLGVVGQVTRVFPMTSEVTLLTDKTQAIPVQILRNGLRSVAYGRGQSPYLDMKVTSNADVQKGDVLVTSGLDGIYPPGLAVAKVEVVENKGTSTFENIVCLPVAGVEKNRQLLILQVSTRDLPKPDSEEVRAKKEKINRRVTRDNGPVSDLRLPAEQSNAAPGSAAQITAPAAVPVAVPASREQAAKTAPAPVVRPAAQPASKPASQTQEAP